MSENYTIAKHPKLEPSQDYAALREEGLAYIQRLAHRLWTDYNVHDPGITMLEVLCYAITDLGYRTALPMEDLLTREKGGRMISVADFHTARKVLTCDPVTFDDLAKLLVDVPGVRNAWIERNREQLICLNEAEGRLERCTGANQGRQVLNGLYDVYLEYEQRVRPDQAPVPQRTGLAKKRRARGGYVAEGGAGIRFDALRPLRLESVTIYPEKGGKVVVRLTKADGTVLAETTETISSGRKSTITLEFDVPAGEGYKLDAKGSEVALYRNEPPPGDAFFPMPLAQLVTLRSGFEAEHEESDAYYFFYDWVISYDRSFGPQVGTPGDVQLTRGEVERAVRKRLHQYRNLCQDVVSLCRLVPEEVAVCADLELEPGADAEEVLTEIVVRLQHHVSPPVRFYSLREMLEKGLPTEEIFAGPRLDHGFIDDREFRERRRRCEIRASDVTRIILEVDGVIAVQDLTLLAFDEDAEKPHALDAWLLPLSSDRTRAPVFKWERSQIVFYRNRLPHFPNRERVSLLLNEFREDNARRRRYSKQASHDLPVPVGTDRSLSDYYPVQNELPTTYRVGRHRVAKSEPAQRHAQSKQLKAYLMFFEQILANYLSQLEHMHELFSWQPGSRRTYFTQLVGDISDLDAIYQEGFADQGKRYQELARIIEDDRKAVARRNGFLDHLLARFSEEFTDYSLLLHAIHGPAAASRVLEDKRLFLKHYPESSRARGTAHDYRHPHRRRNLSGFQRRLYRLLGFPEVIRRNLAGDAFSIVKISSEPDRWQFQLNLDGVPQFESEACESFESAQVLLDHALQLGGKRDSYRPSGDRHELVIKCPDETRVIGRTLEGVALGEVMAYFACVAGTRGFHVVEHILLRPRSDKDPLMPVQLSGEGDCPCIEVTDPYSFRMSIILPSWPPEFQDTRFRAFVEESIRREAPAHLHLRICWISHSQMREFEERYGAWEEALAQLVEDEEAGETLEAAYASALDGLMEIMQQLDNVHPLAQLYDCGARQGQTPRVFLDHSNLGTF